MEELAIFASPGKYVQGRDATAQLGSLLLKMGVAAPGPLLIVASKVC